LKENGIHIRNTLNFSPEKFMEELDETRDLRSGEEG
jgi:hypothetical protein